MDPDQRTSYIQPDGLKCVQAGNNCRIRQNGTIEQTRTEFASFKSYYDNNDVAGYLNLHSRDTLLFVGIEYQQTVRTNIINGTYKVQILSDSSIVVYAGNYLTEQNVICGYIPFY